MSKEFLLRAPPAIFQLAYTVCFEMTRTYF